MHSAEGADFFLTDRGYGVTNGGNMEKGYRLRQALPVCYMVGACVLCLINLLNAGKLYMAMFYLLVFGSAAFLFAEFVKGKLLTQADTALLLLLLLWSVVSVVYNYGFSFSALKNYQLALGIIFVGIYTVARNCASREVCLKGMVYSYVLEFTLINTVVLCSATASLFHEKKADLLWGCFRVGRLTGIGNANTLGICCDILAMLALYSFLSCKQKILRGFFVFSFVLAIFNLGLTNCRTAILSFAFSIGLVVFFGLLHCGLPDRAFGKCRLCSVGKIGLAMFTAIAGTVLIVVICYIPTELYRLVLRKFGDITGNEYLLQSLQNVFVRSIGSEAGTLTDRTLIWRKVLKDAFRNPRLTWFGISLGSTTEIFGVYAGKHEINTIHAHNTFLEMLRRNGIPGLTIVVAFVGLCGLRLLSLLFDRKRTLSETYLAATVSAFFFIGITEAEPFYFSLWVVPFYVCCGFVIGERRNDV